MEDDLKKNGRQPQKKWKMTSKKMKMENELNCKASYWADLTTKTSKTNGFDTIEIDLVIQPSTPIGEKI